MNTEVAQTLSARERLKALLRKVPDTINAGGYQAAVDYKKFAIDALKKAESSKTKLPALMSLINRYHAIEKGTKQ